MLKLPYKLQVSNAGNVWVMVEAKSGGQWGLKCRDKNHWASIEESRHRRNHQLPWVGIWSIAWDIGIHLENRILQFFPLRAYGTVSFYVLTVYRAWTLDPWLVTRTPRAWFRLFCADSLSYGGSVTRTGESDGSPKYHLEIVYYTVYQFGCNKSRRAKLQS